MRTYKRGSFGALASLLILSASTLCYAQDEPPPAPVDPAPEAPPPPPPPPPAETEAQAQAQAQGGATVGVGLPPAPEPDDNAGESDHDSVVGSLGVGYLGRRSLLIASGIDPTDPGLEVEEVAAPVIGVRYWLNDMMGIDAGLGFLLSGGSTETSSPAGDTDDDLQGFKAFIIHGGVPFSLADSQHFSFQVVPELNFGLTSSTIEGDPDDQELSGLHFDIGARVGAEIQFGFIDIPQLSLQGSVGARFAYDKVKAELGDSSISQSTHSFGTNVGDNPWNIFTSNIAALYYF
jgi:hypothetical protein